MSKYDITYLAEDHLWSFLKLPITLPRPRSKALQVNLNFFTNMANRKAQNAMKVRYTDLLDKHLNPKPKTPYPNKVKCLYVYYAPNRAVRDLSNMTTILLKFTEDALVKYGFIVDDNTSFIQNINLVYGGLSDTKENYCNVHIFKDRRTI